MRAALGLLALLVTLSASPAPAAESICPDGSNPDPNVLLCEDFEWSTAGQYDATPQDWTNRGWYFSNAENYGGWGGGVYCNWTGLLPGATDSVMRVFNGQCGLVIRFPPNAQDSPWPAKVFTETGGGTGKGAPLYARYYVFVSADFLWHSVGSKQFYFFARQPAAGGDIIHRIYQGVAGSGTLHPAQAYAVLYPDIYGCESPKVSASDIVQNFQVPPWQAWQPAANQNDIRGRWVAVEIQVVNSTPGVADGEYRLWIDGVKRAEWATGLKTRCPYDPTSTDLRIKYAILGYNGLWINSYLGGLGGFTHPEQEIYYDNLVVSRAPIGLLGAGPGPDTTAPKAPSAFDATLEP